MDVAQVSLNNDKIESWMSQDVIGLHIDGQWRTTQEKIDVNNPATGERIATIAAAG